MPKSYKTTKKHFKLFKKEAKYWIERLHLNSWRVDILHHVRTDLIDGERVLAWCNWTWKYRTSEIYLNKEIGRTARMDAEVLSMAAFHEVCHLLLARLLTNADTNARPAEEDENIEVTHAIIRRLEKAIWEPYRYEN